MPVYFIAIGHINDVELLSEYLEEAFPVLQSFPHELLALDTEAQAVEGSPPGSRVVVLRFDSERDFRTFYDSPAYQEVLGKRLRAVDGFSVLAKGVDPSS